MIRIALVVALATPACSNRTESAPVHEKDTPLARKWIAAGAVVIDVRSREEYAGDHVDRAVNIPVDELAGRIGEVQTLARKDQQIVVYCASGNRAAKAQRVLGAEGYTQVVNGGGVDSLK